MHVWSFRGRRAIRLEVFESESDAFEAVGLSEKAMAQEKVLKAVILEAGRGGGLTSAEVLRRHDVAAATMHKTLGVLDDKGIIREDEAEASPRYKLEDPFFGAWLRHVQESGHA